MMELSRNNASKGALHSLTMDPLINRRWISRVPAIAAALSILSLLASSGFSQAPPAAAQLTAGPSYTRDADSNNTQPVFPNVDLVFNLRTRDASPISNPISMRPGDLKLFYQGQQVAAATSIRAFERTGYGVTSILALDTRSLKDQRPDAIQAAVAGFVKQARPQDKLAVLTFAGQIKVYLPFNTSPDAPLIELPKVEAPGNSTHLYDSLIDALALFANNQPRRRQLLIISDGHDEGSRRTMTEAMLRARSLGVVIDSIGLASDRGEYLTSLQQLSAETDGTFVRAQSAGQLETLIEQRMQASRSTPVATFHLAGVAAANQLLSMQLRWQPGNASAIAFIQTPEVKPSPGSSLVPNLSSLANLWPWVLGSCFVLGVILLAFSGRDPDPQPAFLANTIDSSAVPIPAHPPAALVLSPANNAQAAPIAPRKPVVRAQTLTEGAPGFIARESFVRSPRPAQLTPDESLSFPNQAQFAARFNAPAQGPFARLAVKNGSLAGLSVPVTTRDFNLGAVAGNSLLLPGDLAVSGRHASLHWESSMLHIEDLGSTNGTYLNRLRLAPGRHPLKPGDEIRLGQTVIVVEHA